MDHQEGAGARKRKRKPMENAGARKRNRNRRFCAAAAGGGGGGGGETQQQEEAVAVAAVVGKVAECVQQEDYEGIPEESIAEMMRWLALDLAMPAADGLANAETLAPVASAPAPGYFTMQGDMQSCGPSFSGSASTVMASVDLRFVSPMPPVLPWPWPEAAPGRQEEEVVDDEWLAGLLTDGPKED